MLFSPDSNFKKINEKIKLKFIAQNSTKNPIKPLKLGSGLLFLFLSNFFYCFPALANWGSPTCDVEVQERILKDNLRKGISLATNAAQYQILVAKHKDLLTICRSKNSLKTQALWLRLYPQDTKPEVLEDVLDRIVNRGYNAIFVEVFYDGQILLPVADNPTPWRSLTAEAVKSGQVAANYDLWAEVIRKGRERGLEVYGTSTINFGDYAQSTANTGSDFSRAIAALAQRQPDGILFDYGLYSSGVGNIKDLGIYARQALIAAMPNGTKELMAIYLETGKITPEAIASLHDNNQQKLGIAQSRSNPNLAATAAERILGQLALSHARQGISDLIDRAIANINLPSNSLKIGVAFSPNIPKLDQKSEVTKSQMQPWDRFTPSIERHLRTSSICNDGKCVANEVKKVVNASSKFSNKFDLELKICPVLIGVWGQTFRSHPSLEIQMQAIRAATPQISCVSHLSYSWIEPDSDRQRQAGL